MPLQSKSFAIFCAQSVPSLCPVCAQSVPHCVPLMPRLLTSLEWPICSRKHDVAPNRVGSCTRESRKHHETVKQSQLNS